MTLDASPPLTGAGHPGDGRKARPSARTMLRAGTAGAHEDLDTRLSALDLTDPADYAAFVRVHLAALPPIERTLEEAGVETVCDDWAARRRAGSLQADADRLGLEPVQEVEVDGDALAGHPARLLGTLYVLEGSRLGGEVLLRGIGRGDGIRNATAFLSHGRGEGLWRSFQPRLERGLKEPNERRMAIDAAQRAFATFGLAACRELEKQD